jgi:hypothetical protein
VLLKEKDVQILRNMLPETLDGTLVPDFDQVLKNNQKENIKKGSPRTPLQVLSDTAKGIGFEFYMSLSGLFTQAAPIVEDPRKLNYSDRQKDFWYDGKSVQVKTISRLYGSYAYVSEAMAQSIWKSLDLNDFYLFGVSEIVGERDSGATTFTHEPAFVISSDVLKRILQPGKTHIDVTDMHKRPDHYISLNQKLCLMEA